MNVFQQTTNRALRKTAIVTCLLGVLYTSPAFGDDAADIQRLMRSGNYTEALKKTDKILAQHPTDAQLRFIKGTILAEQNQPDAAIKIFEQLTKDFPDLPEPYNNLAVLYASQQQYDKARMALSMALETNPVYATAQKNLGDIYSTLAHQAYDKALDINDENAAAKKPRLTLVNALHGNITGGHLPTLRPAPEPKESLPEPLPAPQEPPINNPEIVITKSSTPPPVPPLAKTEPTPPVVNKKQEEPKAPEVKEPVLDKKATKEKEVPAAPKEAKESATKLAQADTKKEAKKEDKEKAKAPDNKQSDAKDQQIVSAEVTGWAKAWSSKNVPAYLGYYAPSFKTPSGMSRKAWEANRHDRIVEKKQIRVEVSKIRVTIKDNVATAKFIQEYGSNQLTASTRKTLIFTKIGNRWLITEENVGR